MELAAGELDHQVQNNDEELTTCEDFASGKLNDQGIHECEVWTRDAEGEKKWKGCKKNPRHFKFIPAKKFSIEHLPEAFRDDEVFKYVCLMIERTTKLIVNYTSLDRPLKYPFYKYRGKDVPHTGSGFMYCYEYDNTQFNDDSAEDDVKRYNSTSGRSVLVEGFSFQDDYDDNDEDNVQVRNSIINEIMKEMGRAGECDCKVEGLSLEDKVTKDSVKLSDDNVNEIVKGTIDSGNHDYEIDGSDPEAKKGTIDSGNHDYEIDGSDPEAKKNIDKAEECCSSGDNTEKIYEQFDLNSKPCPCPECQRSDAPCQQWGHVCVFTAKHVVYDTSEAEQTIVEVNFDDDSDTSQVKRLYGIKALSVSNQEEWTMMDCVTHDRDLWVKLYGTYKYLMDLKDTVHEKYWESPDRLCLIVSHPHGWTKQVTVGKWIDRRVLQVDWNGDELSEYTYNTPTCRGSSGASVLILGMRGAQSRHKTWAAHHHVHSASKGRTINISGLENEIKVDLDEESHGNDDDDDDDYDDCDDDDYDDESELLNI